MASRISRRALWLQKITDEVVSQIRRRIDLHALSAGQSPGTRDELAAEFVTSTSVIDRALDQLVEDGVLVPSEAGPVVATEQPASNGFAISPAQTLQDVRAILELRLGLETVSAGLAALRRDEAQLAAIRQAAAAFSNAEGDTAAQADIHFHRAIASAAGNIYLLDLLDYLGPLLMPRRRILLPKTPGTERDGNLEQSEQEHAAILAAITAQEPEAADQAMRAHLLRALALIERSGR
ncbi:FadR/GntR family transcriptional regulator [Primorskyibacter sp. 2E107]|uniref:FadR/GntR family transcriptional regulator n=1 Tax=Primorskyibacter sp. 2E107 TaxID=3403458 RepID=UPI003AF964F3